MSVTTFTPATAERSSLHSATPSFFGLLRGELFKIRKQWTTWIMLGVLFCIMTLAFFVTAYAPNMRTRIDTEPLNFLYRVMADDLSIMRVFIGFFVLILTARVFGLEYQLGTIRIVLARGVGRLQLLSAKLLATVLVALAVFVGTVLYSLIWLCIMLLAIAGNFNAFNAITSTFWSDTGLYVLTVLISMGVSILLSMGVTVLGRSLSFGLSLALSWFAVDNIGTLFMRLPYLLTHNDFWLNITAYFLGPNLNTMPGVLIASHPDTIGIPPWPSVDGTHTLVVTLVYALIFALTAVVLTWKRDVKE